MGTNLGLNAKFGLDGKEFQQGLKGIDSQLRLVQAQFKEAGSRVVDFGTSGEKISGLNRQIELQKLKLEELNGRYLKAVETNGEASAAAMKYSTEIAKAKTALNGLEGELKTTTRSMEEQKFSWASLGSQTKDTSEKAQGHIMNLKNALIGLTATVAGGAGLFKFTENAIEAGNATYELSQKMHISTQEAAAVNKMLKVSDTDSKSFISTLTRMDKSVETAGKKGNATTKAMQEFGLSLIDSTGKLLPMTAQMDNLAAAYQKAADAGREEEFSATLLGTKGQALIPMLEDYKTAKEAAAQVKGIGVDPKQAHDTEVALKALKLQAGALSGVLAKALVPVVQAVIPPLMEGFQKLTEIVKTHKTELDKAIQSFIQLRKELGTTLAPIIKDVFNFIVSHGDFVKNMVLGIGAAFMALKVVNGVIDGIAAAQKAWGGITKALTIAQEALNFVMEMSPFGKVMLVITLLTTAFIYLFNHNKTFHDFVLYSWKVISETVGNAVKFVGGVINGLGDIFTNLPKKAAEWGRDFIQGFIDGIKNMIGGVGNAATDIANKIKSFLHFSVPDEGPLTDYETWMPDFMSGLAKGIKGNKHVVSDALKGLSADMKVNATAGISGNSGSSVTNNKKVEQHVHVENMYLQSIGDKNKALQQLQFLCPI